MAYNEKHVLSRHNHTKEIVSQDLVIGRLIPGSNPGTLFSPILAPRRLHIGFIFSRDKNIAYNERKTLKGVIMQEQFDALIEDLKDFCHEHPYFTTVIVTYFVSDTILKMLP